MNRAAKLPPKRVQLARHEALTMTWKDGSVDRYPVPYLRKWCPCASCRDYRETKSDDPFRQIDPRMVVPEDVHIQHLEQVGHYALKFDFSDGHSTGIYSYDYLIEIAPKTDDGNG
ncbi:MAG: DUF971 domain-containing protein [Candidatus Poribacteria bacterium]|nr:DUF971 domain-containing protein [Candidatus Poribacteria bacterium]